MLKKSWIRNLWRSLTAQSQFKSRRRRSRQTIEYCLPLSCHHHAAEKSFVKVRPTAFSTRSLGAPSRPFNSKFAGCGRFFEAHQQHQKEVGEVGGVPIFIGFLTGWKLANLNNFIRSRLILWRAKLQPSRFRYRFCLLRYLP